MSITEWLANMPSRPPIAEQHQCPVELKDRCLQYNVLREEREAEALRKKWAATPKLKVIAPDITVKPEHLTPEYVIQRWTEPLAETGQLETTVPCCGRLFTVGASAEEFEVDCPFCVRRFDAEVIDEEDGGCRVDFIARAQATFIVVKRRRPKKKGR